jgi:hypothetical protein
MTPEEQLAIWAANPNDEVFVWVDYPQNDEIRTAFGLGDKPCALGRINARVALDGFRNQSRSGARIAANVLAQFQKLRDTANSSRVVEIKGVACVLVEGRSPVSPHSPYRVLLSSITAFR